MSTMRITRLIYYKFCVRVDCRLKPTRITDKTKQDVIAKSIIFASHKCKLLIVCPSIVETSVTG